MSANCLVTGATGYVGGRLVPQLLANGHHVRVLARHPEKLRDIPWVDDVEVFAGDASDAASVRAAMEGMDVAYYLLHSLQEGPQLEVAELGAADEQQQRLEGLVALAEHTGDGEGPLGVSRPSE